MQDTQTQLIRYLKDLIYGEFQLAQLVISCCGLEIWYLNPTYTKNQLMSSFDYKE